MKKASAYVYREVDHYDIEWINDAQQELRRLESFWPGQTPHLTLAPRGITAGMGKAATERIINPLPSSVIEPMTLPVDDIKIMHPHRSVAAYTVTLKDPDGKFAEEQAVFVDRARAMGRAFFASTPHVTLGTVRTWHEDDAIRKDVLDLMPDTLTFEPAVIVRDEEDVAPVDSRVRLVRPRSIPPAFLNSLASDRIG